MTPEPRKGGRISYLDKVNREGKFAGNTTLIVSGCEVTKRREAERGQTSCGLRPGVSAWAGTCCRDPGAPEAPAQGPAQARRESEQSLCAAIRCRRDGSRGHGFDPWSRKIPHATEQLSLCARTTEPAHLEPALCNKRSHRNEKPAHRNEE
ncbi:hypothetical protein J1605_005672 [Eschrichtius robustus]|uniref:Uncharacterized protein n=1 Tax=Eschrichtius robustus TaxID=9764 RepID=A0AB34H7J8_ESCRO|nr:hypothetical protein J1605_005672 [Eschrichtius robustus]